jgi:acyl-CoA reductase-like NAD-dependent aldehyde dehydrogenase
VQAGVDLERVIKAIAFGLSWNGGDTCIAPRRIFVASAIAERFEQLLRAQVPQADSLPVMRYETDEQALALTAQSRYALGACVFGPIETARAFAAKIPAGIVVINDMIMPTADPRATFGGRGLSGFGRTRGAEGLRQFTALKTILVQHNKRPRHLEKLPPYAEELFGAYLPASCATRLGPRLRAWLRLCQVLRKGKRNAS